MTVPYVMRQYYWIPRIYGQDPETGTYAALPAGGWQFISDQDPTAIPFSPAAGLQQRALHLPTWFPRQAYLTGVSVAAASSAPVGNNEFAAWVDPAGGFFLSGSPHGAEAGVNFVNSVPLFSAVYSGGDMRATFKADAPILLDRDAGDLIDVKLGLSQPQDWIYVGFNFLVPNPHPTKP